MPEPVLVQLGELAALQGMPTEATLRKIIRDNPDFPVVSRGQNGVAYRIDLERAVQWFRDNEEKRLQAQRERADELQQFAFDLLGADAASDQSQKGLTAGERKALYEEELLATKLAERKGELIRKTSVEDALTALLVKDAHRRGNFSARLAKLIELPREVIIAIDSLMEKDRKAFAADLETMSETGNAAPAPGADPAV